MIRSVMSKPSHRRENTKILQEIEKSQEDLARDALHQTQTRDKADHEIRHERNNP